jgi:hypothetical protein
VLLFELLWVIISVLYNNSCYEEYKETVVFKKYNTYRVFNMVEYAVVVLFVMNFFVWVGNNPSHSWETQPHAHILLCGERVSPGEWRFKTPLPLEATPVEGVFCDFEEVWYTPGAYRGEVQTGWGQVVDAPDWLLSEFRSSGWFRHWWDLPFDGVW